MKKILLFSVLLAVVLLAVWYFTKKKPTDTAGNSESDKEPETVASPPTGQTPLDPNSGAGQLAVNNQVKNIVESNAYGQIRKGNKIGGDLFSVITHERVRGRIRQTALAGRVDDYSIILLPESYNADFLNQLKELQAFTKDMTPSKVAGYSGGKEAFGKRLLTLSNFSQFDGGFNLFAKLGDVIDNNGGYGECKGNSDMKRSCITSNMSKLSNELYKWSSKMISENKKLSEAIFNTAIANLKASGWVLIGY